MVSEDMLDTVEAPVCDDHQVEENPPGLGVLRTVFR